MPINKRAVIGVGILITGYVISISTLISTAIAAEANTQARGLLTEKRIHVAGFFDDIRDRPP